MTRSFVGKFINSH